MAYLDYGNKQVGIGGEFMPSGDIEADFEIIREFYKQRRGRIPANASRIQTRKKKWDWELSLIFKLHLLEHPTRIFSCQFLKSIQMCIFRLIYFVSCLQILTII